MDDKAGDYTVIPQPIKELLNVVGGITITLTRNESLIKIDTRAGSCAGSEYVPDSFTDSQIIEQIYDHISKHIINNTHISSEKKKRDGGIFAAIANRG